MMLPLETEINGRQLPLKEGQRGSRLFFSSFEHTDRYRVGGIDAARGNNGAFYCPAGRGDLAIEAVLRTGFGNWGCGQCPSSGTHYRRRADRRCPPTERDLFQRNSAFGAGTYEHPIPTTAGRDHIYGRRG